MKLNRKELLDFFDRKKYELRHDISPVISVVGEDLGAALFKRYYEKAFNKKVTIGSSLVSDGKLKGPRLDRWIYVEKSKNKVTAYQTEIKNWSAYAIGLHTVGIDSATIPNTGLLNWEDRRKHLLNRKKNGESKVFYPMRKKPIDFPNNATVEPLIIYWIVLSKDGIKLDPFFNIDVNIKKFKKLNVFSMSNYLRSIKEKEIILDMPNAEKRIKLLSKYFPIK